jgi:hypothetical protein
MIHGRKIFRREAHLMDVHMLLNDEKGAGYSFYIVCNELY